MSRRDSTRRIKAAGCPTSWCRATTSERPCSRLRPVERRVGPAMCRECPLTGRLAALSCLSTNRWLDDESALALAQILRAVRIQAELVERPADDLVAVAGGGAQAVGVEDGHPAAAVADESGAVQDAGVDG